MTDYREMSPSQIAAAVLTAANSRGAIATIQDALDKAHKAGYAEGAAAMKSQCLKDSAWQPLQPPPAQAGEGA